MKTDRELLELAAKAAGYAVEWHEVVVSRRGRFGLIEHTKKEGFRLNFQRWDPLTDDGDALRLAVKLHISPSWSPSKNSVKAAINNNPFLVFGMDATGDDCADIRRIIVRAASAIGEAMQ